jgi:hypothetical protein
MPGAWHLTTQTSVPNMAKGGGGGMGNDTGGMVPRSDAMRRDREGRR